MTMEDPMEFTGELEKFEVATVGDFLFLPEGEYWGVSISLNHSHIPDRGLYSVAAYDLALSFSPALEGTQTELAPAVSKFECRADLTEIGQESWRFTLRDPEDESNSGLMYVYPTFVPEWLDEDADHCFVTLRLEYRHERTKAEYDETDESIQRKRAATKENIEE